MSIVPPGEIRLGTPIGAFPDSNDSDELPEQNGTVVQVNALLLDRYCVTNQDYKRFCPLPAPMSRWRFGTRRFGQVSSISLT